MLLSLCGEDVKGGWFDRKEEKEDEDEDEDEEEERGIEGWVSQTNNASQSQCTIRIHPTHADYRVLTQRILVSWFVITIRISHFLLPQ
ncbi:hypothetical protein M0804_004928 [Polistes exclamans]|nr:hypothetical protein M0804_004928 [Polistes exclamans]